MTKTMIIVAVVVVIIIVLLLTQKESSAAELDSNLQGGYIDASGQFIPQGGYGSIDGSTPIIDLISDSILTIDPKECKKLCKSLCKPYRPIGKRKKRCKDPCRSDCVKGNDVKSIYPK